MNGKRVWSAVRTTLVLGGVWCGVAAGTPVSAETITLVADEWCPINCEPGSDKPGYAVEMARYAFEKAGHTVEYKTVAWARALDQVKKGTHHAAIGASKDEAPDFVYPEAKIGRSANSYFVRSDSAWTYEGLSSYESVCVAVIRDYGYDEPHDSYFEQNKGDPKKVQVASGDDALEQNLKKLVAGRVDVVIEDEPVGRYTINELGLGDKVRYSGNDGEPVDFYIAFSPENPKSREYAEIFTRGVEELRASGKLAEILASYGMTEWE